jgi:hypothetical protein
MVNEFMEVKIEREVYEKYCHIKHYHLDNNYSYPELNSWKKRFNPFDELNAITTALDILKR